MPESILIVDDNSDLAEVLAEIFIASGYRVRVADDGVSGLRMLDDELPDAIVLDIEMPRLSGPQMADRMVRHDAGMEKVPIVLYSGVTGLDEVAKRVGTPYFIGKPFEVGALLGLLRRALDERVPPSTLAGAPR